MSFCYDHRIIICNLTLPCVSEAYKYIVHYVCLPYFSKRFFLSSMPTPGEVVDDYIDRSVQTLPPYLLDLANNQIVSRSSLAHDVKAALRAEYKSVLDLRLDEFQERWLERLQSVVNDRLAYAVLSHRWTEREPTFADTRANFAQWRTNTTAATTTDAGTQKLLHFCAKAQQRHFHLAWSDTCCLDYSNGADVQEVMKSMFQWYRHAALCIVYMADTLRGQTDDTGAWADSWFTRGWTLQELLAPKAIKFYTRDWLPLTDVPNDKDDAEMLRKLHRATGIAPAAIRNFEPGVIDADEKLEWGNKRKTTKAEDGAYSLLGLLGLSMTFEYGEGREKALDRLRKLIDANRGGIRV
jgi:Heterokaryon incompatibility protein (HET)